MAFKRKRNGAAVRSKIPRNADNNTSKIPRSEHDDTYKSDEEVKVDMSSAYASLLLSLKSSGGGQFSKAYARRQREEQGASSDEENEDNSAPPNDDEPDKSDVDEDNIVARENALEPDNTLSDEEMHDTSVDEFKVHFEHNITDEEIASLQKGTWKLNAEVPASGIPKSNWISNTAELPTSNLKLSGFNIKQRLSKNWENVVTKKYGDFRSEQQNQFFALCSSYCDVLHSRKASLIGTKGSSEIMDAYLLHTLNHILKTRDLVIKNNEKLAKNSDLLNVPRDQGFTRPKVLFLLPLRSIALKVVKRLIELSPPMQKATVGNKQYVFEKLGPQEEDLERMKKTTKPRDHQSLFTDNIDDDFSLGMKFTRKSINLSIQDHDRDNDLHSSDVIIASPLSLHRMIERAEADKERDVDFLSSIEILVIDFADVILMQNWALVVSIFDHLNKIPQKQHGADIMRVREWYLNGQARYFRQTIFLSSYADASINALFLRSCFNHRGKIRLQCQYEGILSSVILQVRQIYERLDSSSITDIDNARFNFFVKQVYPRIKESLQCGFLLFVPKYFDFVRLRNFLKSEDASFCLLGEYTTQADISRSRKSFFHGEKRIMLYTERSHFYHRYQIRGIRELIFYSLPDHATFYAELTNMLEGVENPSCTAIYSKFDNQQLERIVGTARAKKLMSAKTKTLMFC